ncbi:MAG: endonuclease/exonuclease/phosphatase family protein [Polyangiales bacterium]
MNRSALFLLTLVVAIGCGDDSGGGGSAGTGGTGGSGGQAEVVIETFNVALAGAFIPFEEERRAPLAQAIADADADILCLQEVWTQQDKDMIATAAEDNYPNVAQFLNDLETPVDDPTDQNGDIPPPPTVPPCPDTEVAPDETIEDQMNAAIDCVRDNCSTIPGDESGQTTSTACAEAECFAQVAALILGNSQQQECYACLVTQLPTSTFGEIRASCPTDPNQNIAFQGQNGVMILSKVPLSNETNWVIPGTWNRRVILSARAELDTGAELDVYCNHLTPIFQGAAFPYTGDYGDGRNAAAGWEAEQRLQAQKLIDYVERTSGDTPAVILGDMNAGRAYPDEDIIAEGERTLDLLESVFVPAYATDYAPQCTFCDTNPITDTDASVWIDHILMYNLDADAVTDTTRTFDENVVPVEGAMIPLSDHFGVQSTILVP